MRAPARLTLPSGAEIRLRATPPPARPRARAEGAPLFSEVLALFDEGALAIDGRDVRDLSLTDFHVVRAVLTKLGWIDEREIEIACANCGEVIAARPCERLEIGPYVDGEIHDPELDAVAERGVPHDLPGLGDVTIVEPTVREAEPMFAALAKRSFRITPAVATAMGVRAIGGAVEPEAIARALSSSDDEAFAAFSDLWLRTIYPARLGAALFCPACKARNDVDAPYERELEPSLGGGRSPAPAFPSFERFAERANELAAPMLAALPGEGVALVVEAGTPAVDDGGEQLLGSYIPSDPGDLGSPSRAPTVTLYYETFRAVAADEGSYDWEGDLEETLVHELEHHLHWLSGDDPMDAEERAEIQREALRMVGRREATRRTMTSFGASLVDFARRTWLLWLIVFCVALLTFLGRTPD